MSPHNGGAGGGSGNGPQLEITGMERRFTQECVNEAFWRRSLPLSGIGVYATYMAAIKGKIGHKYFFPGACVVGMAGYYAGKLQYALSGACLQRFLDHQPRGLVAYLVRENHGTEQPKFLQDPAMQRLYSQKIDAIDDNLDDELYLDDVLETPKLSAVLDRCERDLMLRYSLPSSLFLAYGSFQLGKAGLLPKIRFLETRFGAGGASLPFILGGFVLGGLLGQTMYNVFSFEMMNRVLKEDPKGEAARRIRKYYDLREDARDISTGGIENKSQFHTGAGDEVETLEAQQVAKEKADQDARNKPTVDPHSGYIIESRPTSIKDYLEKVVTKQDLLDRRPKE